MSTKNPAITRAKSELAEEQLEKDVLRLKRKYRELATAEQIVLNLERELEDLEEAISTGN